MRLCSFLILCCTICFTASCSSPTGDGPEPLPEFDPAPDDTQPLPAFTPAADTAPSPPAFVLNPESTPPTVQAPLPQPVGARMPDRTPTFWRATPLAVEIKGDWEQLLADTQLSGPNAPCDGPILILPKGTVLSRRMIATEVEPVLRRGGLVLCETWPTPSLDDAVDLSTIVSPTAPVVKLPDVRHVAELTGLDGPAILSNPDPADWTAAERENRLLAHRDPSHHRLYGLVEQSFCCLTTRLKSKPGTEILRYAADGSAAVSLRLPPQGGAVVVLNAAVQGYAAAASRPAAAVDFLGVSHEFAARLLAGAKGGVGLRTALTEIHRRIEAHRKAADNQAD